MILLRLALVILALCTALPGGAQERSGLARVEAGRSGLSDDAAGGMMLELGLSQPVPWRVITLADPHRLVVDFREVNWEGFDSASFLRSARAGDVRFGQFRPGWSRLVVDLGGPYAVRTAGMATGTTATLRIALVPVSEETFAAQAGAPESALWDLPKPAAVGTPKRRQQGDAPVIVVLDPGHGGIDPGAEHGGTDEAALMLTFARELKEALIRAGGFRVEMTRTEDVFVPLESRISFAHEVLADVFLSLHADALAEGEASGATVYTLAQDASDAASAALAERHDRADILAGVDLRRQDDQVAGVLMDLARAETAPRSGRLADRLVAEIKAGSGPLYKKPRREAGFSVLKSSDIPSVLVELGYMSNAGDFSRLSDPAWRARMVGALVRGLQGWAVEDAAEAVLLRQ